MVPPKSHCTVARISSPATAMQYTLIAIGHSRPLMSSRIGEHYALRPLCLVQPPEDRRSIIGSRRTRPDGTRGVRPRGAALLVGLHNGAAT